MGLKPRLRELTLGPWEAWGFWSWTHHDGSTWAALGFDGDTTKPEALIGWAALTMQVDDLPVVGVYVEEGKRRGGRGELLLTTLLTSLVRQGILYHGATIAASTQRWEQYPKIIGSCGLRCVTWGAEAP